MPDLLPELIKYFVGGLIGCIVGWFAHFWACRREAKTRIGKAKDEFFSVLAAQKSALDALNRGNGVFGVVACLGLASICFGAAPLREMDELRECSDRSSFVLGRPAIFDC